MIVVVVGTACVLCCACFVVLYRFKHKELEVEITLVFLMYKIMRGLKAFPLFR